MNDSFYEFCNMVGDPAWVCLACFCTGFVFGFLVSFLSALVEEVFYLLRERRRKQVVTQSQDPGAGAAG